MFRDFSVRVQGCFSLPSVQEETKKMIKLNLNIPDFEGFTDDQQFVNVVGALTRMETQQGGLGVSEIWQMAWQVVEMLKAAQRPDITAKILLTLISRQIDEQMGDRTHEQNIHSTHCVLFCVNYLLCANAEEPDPNEDIIDSISEELAQMTDIVDLFEAVEREEDQEEARGHKVKERNVLADEEDETQGLMHEMAEGDHWIVSKLEQLVSRGVWQKGLTAEDVMHGLRKALALEAPGLSTEQMAMSNRLWALLHQRRNQQTLEQSVCVTWLNIVGYCVRHGMLEGASTPLCRQFYDHPREDDYKHIDRGRSGVLKSFMEIEPLLDTYLKF